MSSHILTNGQVPETVMTGETANISAICKFASYDWVMFFYPTLAFPENTITLGRYLGPATNFGTAMTETDWKYYLPQNLPRPDP